MLALSAGLALAEVMPQAASASGGATAGEYTSQPIAKRRYYQRVKQAVYEFNVMGEAIKQNKLQDEDVTGFFSLKLVTYSARKKQKCVGAAPGTCDLGERRRSRYDDMKVTMSLLGNAFRADSQTPPDAVQQVREAKAFFAAVEKMQKALKAEDQQKALVKYASAKDALEAYLNDVDLPPTTYPDYNPNIDMTEPALCQGSFCI
jgi:hypothetical protein